MANKLCLLVCQNFLAETSAVVAEAGVADVQVAVFAAACIRPTNDTCAISQRAVERAEHDCDVVLLGGHCINGVAAAERGAPGANNVQVAALPRCLDFVAPAPLVDAEIAAGAYLLTPGWLRNWRRTMAEWGFDRPTAREFFAETTRQLTLLDTGTDAPTGRHLHDLADFLALPAKVIPVGLDLLRLRLIRLIREWRGRPRRAAALCPAADIKPQLADYTLAFDFAIPMIGAKT